MKKFVFIFFVTFLISSFIFNIINDFDVLALVINGLALIGLLTVGRSMLLEKIPHENEEECTDCHTHDWDEKMRYLIFGWCVFFVCKLVSKLIVFLKNNDNRFPTYGNIKKINKQLFGNILHVERWIRIWRCVSEQMAFIKCFTSCINIDCNDLFYYRCIIH